MYVKRMALCATVLLVLACGWAGAEVLLNEDFQGNVGWDIINYGNGNHWMAVGAHYDNYAVVSAFTIDDGNSAYNNPPGFNQYKRVPGYFVEHTLVAGESVEATWVEMLPLDGATQSGVGMYDSGNRSWRMYLARNTYDGGLTYSYEWMAYGYDSLGNQQSSSYPGWTTLPAKYGTHIDAKIAVTATTARYYVKAHGAATYDLLWTLSDGGMPNVNSAELLLWGDGPTYIDSILVQSLTTNTLTGQLDLTDFHGDPYMVPVKVDFTPQGSGTAKTVEIRPATVSSQYTITPIADGTYDVTFSAAQFLTRKLTDVVMQNGGTVERNVSLFNGDVDGIDGVTSTDVSVVLKNLGLMDDW